MKFSNAARHTTASKTPSATASLMQANVRRADFRPIALRQPKARESSHMGHPDFRGAGRVSATLGHPNKGWARVKLNPEQKAMLVESEP